MYSDFKQLIVWQKAMFLVEEIYRLTQVIPGREQFGLASQMQRAAVSIPSNIAEGRGRKTELDYNFLHISYGSILEVETQLEIALRLEYVKPQDIKQAQTLIQEVSKMLYKMLG